MSLGSHANVSKGPISARGARWRRGGILGISALLAWGGSPTWAASKLDAAERKATIFYTGAVRGTLEPCGCTSDPLGDVARMTAVVRSAGKGNVLLVDAGNLLYPGVAVPSEREEGAALRAQFLATELAKLPLGGVALGEDDLAQGPAKVMPKRLAANLTGAPFLEPSPIREVGGIRIGIIGLADPALATGSGKAGDKAGWKAEDPTEAATREAKRLRAAGAEIVIVVAALERAAARQVARAAPVDFVVVGQNVGDGVPRADRVGDAYVVTPAEELQRLGRIDLVVRGRAPSGQRISLRDAGGEEARRLERSELERRGKQLEDDLVRFAKDGSADPAFVAARKKEREELAGQLKALGGTWTPPASGSYFTNQLIPMRRALPRDPLLAAAMRKLDQQSGAANLRHAAPPPPPPPGRASYVGDQSCGTCHKSEAAFWKTTVHAHAWKTLVDAGKTGFDDCVACHVTGFGEMGGASLGHVERLTNVQCEVCHGPGSLHVAARGLEEPSAVHVTAPQSTCIRCHTEKHSDTFNYAAYLRDVLGPGHGKTARETLGPGPTGRELRTKALARAKAAGRSQVGNM